MTMNENTLQKVEGTVNNALDGDVVLSVVQAATDSNGWWMEFVASTNAVGTLIVGIGTLVVAVWAIRLTRRQTDIQDANRETARANLKVAKQNLELAIFNKERDEAWRRHELFDRRYPLYVATNQVLGDVAFGTAEDFEKSYDDFQRLRLRDQYYLKEELSLKLLDIFEELTRYTGALRRTQSGKEEIRMAAVDECVRLTAWAEQEWANGEWATEFQQYLRVD